MNKGRDIRITFLFGTEIALGQETERRLLTLASEVVEDGGTGCVAVASGLPAAAGARRRGRVWLGGGEADGCAMRGLGPRLDFRPRAARTGGLGPSPSLDMESSVDQRGGKSSADERSVSESGPEEGSGADVAKTGTIGLHSGHDERLQGGIVGDSGCRLCHA